MYTNCTNNTWVRNISSTPLTEAQAKVLSHRPNYTVLPRNPPVAEYRVSIEQVYTALKQGEVEELRGEVKPSLRRYNHPKYSITREEHKTLGELKKYKNRIILTADKAVSIVLMDKEDYNRKAEALLRQPTYKPIPTDPTNKYKNKLISQLKTINTEGGINEVIYRRLYSTGASLPKFYGLPKVHKTGMPLRPIVSSTGAVTYERSKELSRILKPLVGKSPYQVQNNQEFIQQIKGIKWR